MNKKSNGDCRNAVIPVFHCLNTLRCALFVYINIKSRLSKLRFGVLKTKDFSIRCFPKVILKRKLLIMLRKTKLYILDQIVNYSWILKILKPPSSLKAVFFFSLCFPSPKPLRPIQYLHKLITGYGFLVIKIHCKLIELCPVLLEDFNRLFVLLFDEGNNE